MTEAPIICIDDGDKAQVMNGAKRLQRDSYDEAKLHLKQSLKDANAQWKNDENALPPRVHDAIFVDGGRGTGKTAFILNLGGACEGDEFRGLHFCSPIDPTLLEKKESFLNLVIAKLHQEVKNRKKQGSTDYYAALQEVADAMEGLGEGEGEAKQSGMERILSHGGGIALIGRLDQFYREACKALGCKAVVLPIDDVDMAFKGAFGILDVVRRYLASPLVIPVITGDFRLYSHLVDQRFHEDLVNTTEQRPFDSGELAEQYLRKVLPAHRRTRLATVPELIEAHDIQVQYGGETVALRPVLHFIKHLMYRLTNGVEDSHPNFMPGSTRELVQFLIGLEELVKATGTAKVKDEKEALAAVRNLGADVRARLLEVLAGFWASIENWPHHYRARADLDLVKAERPLHDPVFFNALRHPPKRSSYDWDAVVSADYANAGDKKPERLNNTLVPMPTLERYTEHAVFTKGNMAALSDANLWLMASIFSHDNYYSTYQATNLVFFGRAFEIVVTSLCHDLTVETLKSILWHPPCHSHFGAFRTKAVDDDAKNLDDPDESDDWIEQNKKDEAIFALVGSINEWRKSIKVVPSANLIQMAMNKAFNHFAILKMKAYIRNDTMDILLERFRRIVLNSFASFEKDITGGNSIVVLQNVGIRKTVNKSRFSYDPAYRTNIAPLLEQESITSALSKHPLFTDFSEAGLDELDVSSVRKPSEGYDETGYAQKVRRRVEYIIKGYVGTIISLNKGARLTSIRKSRLESAIIGVLTDPLLTENRELLTEKTPYFGGLLTAARKHGLAEQLEAWLKE